MRKIVQARQEANDKGYDYVEHDEQQFFDGRYPALPCIQQVQEQHSYDGEQCTRSSSRRLTIRCKVAGKHIREDAGAEIYEDESDRANEELDIAAKSKLDEHIECYVDYSSVQENGRDEAPPLIRCWNRTRSIRCKVHARSTQVRQVAIRVRRCGIRTLYADVRLRDQRTQLIAVLVPHINVLHARRISRAHVDQYVWRRADHRIEARFDSDRGAREYAVAHQLRNEDGDLYQEQNVAAPSDLALEPSLLFLPSARSRWRL